MKKYIKMYLIFWGIIFILLLLFLLVYSFIIWDIPKLNIPIKNWMDFRFFLIFSNFPVLLIYVLITD